MQDFYMDQRNAKKKIIVINQIHSFFHLKELNFAVLDKLAAWKLRTGETDWSGFYRLLPVRDFLLQV